MNFDENKQKKIISKAQSFIQIRKLLERVFISANIVMRDWNQQISHLFKKHIKKFSFKFNFLKYCTSLQIKHFEIS